MKKSDLFKTADALAREKYGWTQAQLADYLDITRGQLAMSEIGERSLPYKASLKWLDWFLFTYAADALEKARANLELPIDTKPVLRRIGDCEWEAAALQQKKEAMQKRYDKALNSIALCQHLLAKTPDTEKNVDDRRQLQVMLILATRIHKKDGLPAQALLQCKIEGLLYEAEQGKKWLAAQETGEEEATAQK